MLQKESIVNVTDNSGAKQFRVIGIPGHSKKKFAGVGEIVMGAVHGANSGGAVANKQKVKGLIVRARKEKRRADGSYVRFDDNAVVLVDKDGNPLGTRVFGPVAREVRDGGYTKITSLATEVW